MAAFLQPPAEEHRGTQGPKAAGCHGHLGSCWHTYVGFLKYGQGSRDVAGMPCGKEQVGDVLGMRAEERAG